MEDPRNNSSPFPLQSGDQTQQEIEPINKAQPSDTLRVAQSPNPNTLELKPQNINNVNDSEPEVKMKEKTPKENKVSVAKYYDYDACPPDFGKAKVHGRARRIYAALSHIRNPKTVKVCDCCGNAYDLKRLDVSCDRADLYHLGAGFPLYFEFIVFCVVLLILILLIGGIYDFVTNMIKDDCENNLGLVRNNREFCDLNRISRMSLLNKRFEDNLLEIGNWLNFATVIVMLIAFQIYGKQSRLTAQQVDNSQQTPADFTIVISNMPKDATDQEIKDYIEKKIFKGEVQVAKIVRGYDIGEFVKLTRRKATIQTQLSSKKGVHNKEKLQEELEDIRKRLDTLENNASKSLEYSSYVYITFETEKNAKDALDKLGFYNSPIRWLFYHMGCYNCFKDTRFRDKTKLRALRAPEPNDILWENLGTAQSIKFKRRLISLLVSISVIIVCFGIITGFNVLKAIASNSQDQVNVQTSTSVGIEILSIVIAILILIVNNFLNILTRRFAAYESHSTFTDYFVSVARRLTLSTFINSAFTILITCYVVKNLWKEGGLVNQVFINFIVTAVVGPLTSIFDPFYYMRLYKRSKVIKEGKACTLTQKEANLLFEGPPIDMALCYSNVLKAVWLAAFYAPLLPVGLPISFVGLVITYWVNKYLLLRRYVKPLELGQGLSFWMSEYLELTPFFFAAGNFIFRTLIVIDDSPYPQPPNLASILSIAVAAGSILIPFETLFECFSKDDNSKSNKYTYSDMRAAFNNDYDICNPIYHEAALDEWLKAVGKVDKDKQNALQDIMQPGSDLKTSMDRFKKG